MDLEKTAKNLRTAGFSVQVFDSGAEAAEWLNWASEALPR